MKKAANIKFIRSWADIRHQLHSNVSAVSEGNEEHNKLGSSITGKIFPRLVFLFKIKVPKIQLKLRT